jgi:acetoin utilization deacetylase AcuC-like enzyme
MTPGEPVWLFTDTAMRAHVASEAHPERPARLDAILRELQVEPIDGVCWLTVTPATPGELTCVHAAEHVDAVISTHGRPTVFDEDTATNEHSVDAALLAAGAARDAIAAVARGSTRRAFALCRPPGHHAERSRAMGFCLFNNVAFGVQSAIEAGLARRVAVVDFDVHHGNGTEEIFYERGDVLVCNLHQSPLYPGTGARQDRGRGAGEGATVNVPLPPGIDTPVLVRALEDEVVPAVVSFGPDLLVVSAGFDGHKRDRISQWAIDDEGYRHLSERLVALAERCTAGRVAFVLEGGYELQGLARGVRSAVLAMRGGEVEGG